MLSNKTKPMAANETINTTSYIASYLDPFTVDPDSTSVTFILYAAVTFGLLLFLLVIGIDMKRKYQTGELQESFRNMESMLLFLFKAPAKLLSKKNRDAMWDWIATPFRKLKSKKTTEVDVEKRQSQACNGVFSFGEESSRNGMSISRHTSNEAVNGVSESVVNESTVRSVALMTEGAECLGSSPEPPLIRYKTYGSDFKVCFDDVVGSSSQS